MMKRQELKPPDIGSTEISNIISGETGLLIKHLTQFHQSHGQLFFQTTTDLAVGIISSHPGASLLSAPIPTQIEISTP